MKKKDIPLGQYSSETKSPEGATDDFLDTTEPLIGYIVHSFNALDELLNSEICRLNSNAIMNACWGGMHWAGDEGVGCWVRECSGFKRIN
jgi:hypothetical protein